MCAGVFRILCYTEQFKLHRPGTAKEGRNTAKQTAAVISPNDRQPAPLTDLNAAWVHHWQPDHEAAERHAQPREGRCMHG